MSDNELLSTSELARRFNLDRVTVAKRLRDFPPVHGAKNAKLYPVDEVTPLLESEDDTGIQAAKLRRAIADAERAELVVAKLRGDLVNRMEVMTEVQELFHNLYQKVCVIYPRRNGARLHKSKTAAELVKKLQADLMEIFNELSEEHSFSGSDTSGDTAQ